MFDRRDPDASLALASTIQAEHVLAGPAPGTVDLWQFHLSTGSPKFEDLRMLSSDEIQRAERFANSADRNRFVCRRASLRRILASYLGVEAKSIEMSTGEYGKPELPDDLLSFSCAFSGDIYLLAFATDCGIGVDIERVNPGIDRNAISEIAFNPAEIAWIDEQIDPVDSFTRVWAIREAIFKGWGKGLHDSMPATSVVAGASLVRSVPDPEGGDWWFNEIVSLPGYRAAIATSRPDQRIQRMVPEGGNGAH